MDCRFPEAVGDPMLLLLSWAVPITFQNIQRNLDSSKTHEMAYLRLSVKTYLVSLLYDPSKLVVRLYTLVTYIAEGFATDIHHLSVFVEHEIS